MPTIMTNMANTYAANGRPAMSPEESEEEELTTPSDV